MEFQTSTTFSPPKNLYPCLATITVVPHGTDTRSRRLSGASFGSNAGGGSAVADDDGGALKRVISGGRRKTSFGVVADRGDLADVRRKSFSGTTGGGDEAGGKWYWRVQAGATDHHIVLLPLTQPPNPVLTTPPQPLSHAMPAHSNIAGNRTGAAGQSHDQTAGTGREEEHQGIGTKIKNLFRRPSAAPHDSAAAHGADHAGDATGPPTGVADPTGNGNDTISPATSTTTTAVDRVIDQTPQGDMLPSAPGNAVGATNLNANAENGWPGVIQGQHLAGISVDLHAIDKSRVTLGGGKKNEGSTVTIHVLSFGQSGFDRVGANHHDSPKSGTIKFEFDKDWIGAKGEAELLHHHITSALENLPDRGDGNTAGGGVSGERPFPQAENFQLGGGQSHVGGGVAGTGHPNVPSANLALGREVAPDERAI